MSTDHGAHDPASSVLDVDSAGRAGMDDWRLYARLVGGEWRDEADVPSWDEL